MVKRYMFSQRLVKPVDQRTAKRGETRAKKKNNEPADKNTVCSDKSTCIQVCNFCSVFQTLLKSDFIDAVNSPKYIFLPKFSPKSKCRLYTNAGYTPPSVENDISVYILVCVPASSSHLSEIQLL